MDRKGISVCLVMVLLLGSMVVLDVTMDITPKVEAITIYVDDDYGSEDATHKMTIQAAVDAANPGDTVYVYNGTYYENVTITKILNLTGESIDDTIVNATGNGIGILVENVDYVNISGFTIENGSVDGIQLYDSNNSTITNLDISYNYEGIGVIFSDYNTISNCSLISNIDGGIYIHDDSNYNEIFNSNISMTQNKGITLWSSHNVLHDNYYYKNGWNSIQITGTSNILIYNETIEKSWFGGIAISGSQDNTIINVSILNSEQVNAYGIFFAEGSDNNTLIESKLFNNPTNIAFPSGPDYVHRYNYVINTTINNSSNEDIWLRYNSHLIVINSTFNQSSVYFEDWMADSTNASLTVQWYLNVNVTNSSSQSIPNATVCIKDNQNSLPAQKYTTDSQGYVRWLTQIEYIEQDTNGDTVGEKTYYTPHRITAWNETLMGYAEVNINESEEVNIVLDTPYSEIPLSAGWNLISLPLVQSDTSIVTVLSSIAGNYDIVQWYNASDGQWYSTNDDLTDINHSMGFWIHMKTADTLIVTGSIPNTTSIQLYQGWNLVGNPSFCIHGIDDILSPIATKYTAVQQYDAWDSGDPWKHYHINKPSNLNDLAYMTSGKGYWLYVKEDVVWEVSNF